MVSFSIVFLVLACDGFSEKNFAAKPPTIRIITYNIHSGKGMDGKFDMARIANIIRAENPDIVCFQEITRNMPYNRFTDMPHEMSILLKMKVVFAGNLNFGPFQFGNATLTRLKVKRHKNIELPVSFLKEPRGCLQTVFELPNGSVTVLNTHLGLSEKDRKKQVQAILMELGSGPVVLVGDFNEKPGGRNIKLLTGKFSDAASAFPEPTYPTDQPLERIDYIFHSADVAFTRIQVIDNENVKSASDHIPLVGDFQLIKNGVEN